MGMVLRQRMTGAVVSARLTTEERGCRPMLGNDCAFAPAGGVLLRSSSYGGQLPSVASAEEGVPVTLLRADAQAIQKWYRRQLAGTGKEFPGNSPSLHRVSNHTIA